MSKSKKFSKKVFPELYENAAKTFETLNINMLRGVCVIFSKGLCVRKSTDLSTDLFQWPPILIKKNYNNLHLSDVMPLALVVPYNKLVKFLNEVGIGTLKSVRESFVLIWSLRIRLNAVTEI